jgi:hypothetical protein
MTLPRARVIPAIVAAIVAVVAFLVFRGEPEAAWLRVEAPAVIVAGEPFVATVTLLEPADGALLDVDLHASEAGEGPVRVVAAGAPRAVAGGQRTFRFALVLREPIDVARVHAIVFLSRSGQWGDAFRVARSESLAVVRGTPRAEDLVARPLRVHDPHGAAAIGFATAPLVRTAIAALWLGAALVAARTWRRATPGAAAGGFVVACLALAAWEALAAGPWLSDHARPLARAAGLYDGRRIAQQMGTIALAGGIGVLALIALRRAQWLPGLALAGIALYAVVALAGMLSLHEVDRLLASGIGPWPLADVLRLAGAGAAVVAAARRAAGTT